MLPRLPPGFEYDCSALACADSMRDHTLRVVRSQWEYAGTIQAVEKRDHWSDDDSPLGRLAMRVHTRAARTYSPGDLAAFLEGFE